MQVKLHVGFESFQDTFDRLQTQLASGASQEEELRRIREQGQELNQIAGQVLGATGKARAEPRRRGAVG